MKRILGWVVAVWSMWLIISGIEVIIVTSGLVQGSEFGMLISIANILGRLTVWIALLGLWMVAPEKKPVE